MLRREQEEAKRLADAIHLARNGQQPNWPAPSGAPLDIVVEALRSRPLMVGAPCLLLDQRERLKPLKEDRQGTVSMTPRATCRNGCDSRGRLTSCRCALLTLVRVGWAATPDKALDLVMKRACVAHPPPMIIPWQFRIARLRDVRGEIAT